MSSETPYPYLDRVSVPADMRTMSVQDLKGLANDVRQFLIEVVAHTGGHLGAGLGAVELAVALHYVFNTPEDNITASAGF